MVKVKSRKPKEELGADEPHDDSPSLKSTQVDRATQAAERKDRATAALNTDLNDPQFLAVYNAVKGMVVGQTLSAQQITIMVPLAMQAIANVSTMDGQQKRDLIIRVFTYLVEQMTFASPDQQALAQNFVDNGIGSLIDTAYQASQGTYTFSSSNTNPYTVDQFNVVYTNIKDLVVNKQLDVQTIIILVPTIMEQVGAFSNLSGLQKKDMVIQIIQKLLTDFQPSNENAQIILTFISAQLPYIIEVIYQSALGNYIYDKVQSGWAAFWANPCSCCKKTTTAPVAKGKRRNF